MRHHDAATTVRASQRTERAVLASRYESLKDVERHDAEHDLVAARQRRLVVPEGILVPLRARTTRRIGDGIHRDAPQFSHVHFSPRFSM